METYKVLLKKMEIVAKGFFSRLIAYEQLRRQNYTVDFVHEGHVVLKLPKISLWRVLAGHRNFDYMNRPRAEILLRKTVYDLYKTGYISKDKSVVDIGCWIADNSVVWAKFLSTDAYVFAIDPSPGNQSYGKVVAEINGVNNIKWVEAVCTEKSGEKLTFEGSLDHTTFKKSNSDRYLLSSTLDEIVSNEEGVVVGLLHVDVEGFELPVLKGAREFISRDGPVICFEQHISREDVKAVSQFLKDLGYRIFMINEVLPGCSLDCRNFLAFPASGNLPVLSDFDQKNALNLGVYSAAVGPSLIEI